MSAISLRCPHPDRCGSIRHRPGSSAARTCASRTFERVRAGAGAPPPPLPPGGRPRGFVAGADAAGGYDAVETYVDGGGFLVTEYRLDESLHRTDGPAKVIDNPDGVDSCSWYAHGERHRGDGPAMTGGGRTEWWYRGEKMPAGRTKARLGKLLDAGADPSTVVGWLGIDDDVALAVAGRVGEPDGVLAAWKQGVREPEMLLAVADGSTPLSWALAGEQQE